MTERNEDLPPVVEIPGDEAEQAPLPMEDPPLEPGDQEEPLIAPGDVDDHDTLPPIPN